MHRQSASRFAFPALLAGATGIGFAPIFVRISETGPIATAFYRLLLALPFIWIWALFDRPRRNTQNSSSETIPRQFAANERPQAPSRFLLFALAGFFFAGDLAFWHWSIQLTSVANSTLLINFAPFFVILGARMMFEERVTTALLTGMCIAVLGGAMLVGASVQIKPQNVAGDALALVTALFYAGYLLMTKRLRREVSTVYLMAGSGVASCLFLGLATWLSGESFFVGNFHGWFVLLGLALVSHVGGQSLIAFALAHLPASFSSVSLLFQPVIAAILAWLILGEPLTLWQGLGAVTVLLGIAVASMNRQSS